MLEEGGDDSDWQTCATFPSIHTTRREMGVSGFRHPYGQQARNCPCRSNRTTPGEQHSRGTIANSIRGGGWATGTQTRGSYLPAHLGPVMGSFRGLEGGPSKSLRRHWNFGYPCCHDSQNGRDAVVVHDAISVVVGEIVVVVVQLGS
jgi:hypothetical protein